MNWKRRPARLMATIPVLTLIVAMLVACGTATPSTSPSPSASAKASTAPASASPSSAAPSSTSPSAKPAGSGDPAYQKAMDGWPKVVEAARKEGEAILYTITDPTITQRWESTFNKIDPKIQVKFNALAGGPAIERFTAERSTKNYVSNAYFTGSPATRLMAEQGLGQLIDDLPVLYEPGAKWVVPPLQDKPKETLNYSFNKYFILVNTNLVPAGQEPKSWKDLGDPKWKDKLVIWEPRQPSIGQAVFSVLYLDPEPGYGPDLVRKIVENTRIVGDPNESARSVARGDMAVTVGSWGMYQVVKDAPVKAITPTDGALATTTQVIVAKTAPQLNATKVFLNWFLGKDAQRMLSEGYAMVRADVDPLAKEAQIGDAKFRPNSPPNWDFEMSKQKEATKVFGKWLDDLGK